MTPEQRRMLDAFSEFEQQHAPDFEDFLDALAVSFRERAPLAEHPEVQGCLLGVAEHLEAASLAFYASTK